MTGLIHDMLGTDTSVSDIPGVQVEVFLCPTAEIVLEPPISADLTTLEHNIQDFTFTAGTGLGYFRRFQMRTKSGEISSEMIGEVGVFGFKHKLEGFIPKGGVIQNQFINSIKNRMLRLLVTENSGMTKSLGTKGIPCYLTTAVYNSGKQVGDAPGPGWLVTFEADAIDPLYIFEGTPNTTPNA